MSFTDKHIVDTYSALFEGLSSSSKIELIEHLSKSLEENGDQADRFFSAFGAFGSDKSAEQIVTGIKTARKFKSREISF